jgi:hypothetical protein
VEKRYVFFEDGTGFLNEAYAIPTTFKHIYWSQTRRVSANMTAIISDKKN